MVKVDLITGFLGAGKTTFIRRYADYFMRKGQRINIIENEFGGVNVDAVMLKNEDYDISQIAGGCMCCTAKIAFQNMLLDAAASGYDRILVEPSGIYDVDEFFETMLTKPVKDCCEIGSILTIADARFDEKLSSEAQYIMFSQLLCTGMVIMSKTRSADADLQEKTISKWNQIIREHGSTRVFGGDVCRKDWDEFTDEDFAAFASCGCQILEHEREFMQHGRVFTARVMANLCENAKNLEERLHDLLSDPRYGIVLRVKGHIADTAGNWYEINCSLDGFYIKPVSMKKGLFLVIGQDLNETAVMEAFIPRQKK